MTFLLILAACFYTLVGFACAAAVYLTADAEGWPLLGAVGVTLLVFAVWPVFVLAGLHYAWRHSGRKRP